MSIKKVLWAFLTAHPEVMTFYKFAVMRTFFLTIYLKSPISANKFSMISMTAATEFRKNIILFIFITTAIALLYTITASFTV